MIIQSPKKRRWKLLRLLSRPLGCISLSRVYGRDALLVMLLTFLWTFYRREFYMMEDTALFVLPEQRIVMVTYLFGTAASYVRMFAESARHSGIDVVIVGSPEPTFSLPLNVRYVPLSWEEFVDRVSTRLFDGQEELPNLMIATRYKAIDFKPAFAYLFPEVVEGYDWWGHLDNDLLLGDVRHFISQEMLSHYDWIPGIPPKGRTLKNWGPFTLYRNFNKTNQLFRLASHTPKELYDTRDPLFIDEWGEMFPGKSPYWNSTMSGIMTNNYKRLGIRVWRNGFPLVWDGSCKRGQERCAECTLDLRRNAQQRLTQRVADENCTLQQECRQEEVLLCHYQRSKKKLEASLMFDSKKATRLIKDGRLRANYLEGFVSYPK